MFADTLRIIFLENIPVVYETLLYSGFHKSVEKEGYERLLQNTIAGAVLLNIDAKDRFIGYIFVINISV